MKFKRNNKSLNGFKVRSAVCAGDGYWSGYWTWNGESWFWTWVWNPGDNGWLSESP